MKMNIFNSISYKDYIRECINENETTYGYQSRLAEAAGCQRSFLSHVLTRETHLSLEHAIRLCEFWGFSEAESEYFLLAVQKERAGDVSLVQFFTLKMEQLAARQKNLLERFGEQAAPEHVNERYYMSWRHAAIHCIVSIPEYQTPDKISSRLGLPLPDVRQVLKELVEMGFVEKKGDKFFVGQRSLHVPKTSRFASIFHEQWRNRAHLDSLQQNSKSIHYTSLLSLSKMDVTKLESLILNFIDETRRQAASSDDEDLVCFLIDFFRV